MSKSSKDLKKKILKKIKSKKIKPKSKWIFLSCNYLIWFSSILSLFFSSLFLAVIFYFFKSNDWELRSYISSSVFKFIIISLPYFWIVFLSISVYFFYYLFRKTKKGYKYSLALIIIFSFGVSLVAGFVFHHNFNLGRCIERMLYKKSFYHKLDNRKRIWDKPHKGRFGGVVVEIVNNDNFFIENFRKEKWQIMANMKTRRIGDIEIDRQIKVIGREVDDHVLRADLIKVFLDDEFLHKKERQKRGERNFFERRIR